jgi:voltage-gated potassium channel
MPTRESRDLATARARLKHIGWLLVGWVLAGMIANLVTRHDGIYDAFIFTIDTLAYLAPRQVGAAWVIQVVLLHGGTVITWYIGWYVVDLVMDKHLWRTLREARRMKHIETISDHVIICGGGRIGAHLGKLLFDAGKPFVVIDESADRADELRALGWIAVEGDARDEEVLRRAGVQRAKRVVAALPTAERNVFVVLGCKRIRADVVVDARCEDDMLGEMLSHAGAARVIFPERACAEQLVMEPAG